jgi:hypothetical protein
LLDYNLNHSTSICIIFQQCRFGFLETGSRNFLFPEEIELIFLRSTYFLHHLISKTILKQANLKKRSKSPGFQSTLLFNNDNLSHLAEAGSFQFPAS